MPLAPKLLPAQRKPTVVLVTLDGVRWQEVFLGVEREKQGLATCESAAQLMPHLHRMMTDGVALGGPGSPALRASGPNYVSLPGYMELFLGRQSQCTENDCAQVSEATLLDHLVQLPTFRFGDVAAVSSWPDIERAWASKPNRILSSAGRSGGVTRKFLARESWAERALVSGQREGAKPGHGDFRPDRFTASLGEQILKEEQPRFLYIGLGEPDEYGHLDDYPGYLAALRYADERIGRLYSDLQAIESQGGETMLVITTDHGRADSFVEHGRGFPESSRVWMVASGALLTAKRMRSFERFRTLADLAAVLREVFSARKQSEEALPLAHARPTLQAH